MYCKCKQCGREYEFNKEIGYSRDLCGAYCDGLYVSNKRITALESELKDWEEDCERHARHVTALCEMNRELRTRNQELVQALDCFPGVLASGEQQEKWVLEVMLPALASGEEEKK